MSTDYGAGENLLAGEKLLTKGEVAQMCRVETRTVERWVAAGKIIGYRTPGGRLLFRRKDVLMVVGRAHTTLLDILGHVMLLTSVGLV